MAKFRVLKPVAVTTGEGAEAATRHYRHPGVVVEIDEEQAASLVADGRVERVGAAPKSAEKAADKPRTDPQG